MQVFGLIPLADHTGLNMIIDGRPCSRDEEISAQAVQRFFSPFMPHPVCCCQDRRQAW
jgi:hypothetical protein